MKIRQQAAEEFADNKERRLTSYHRGLKEGFLAGCEYTDGEHREFYLTVREFMSDSPKSQREVNQLTKIIDYHLASFTEREQPKD